MKPRVYDDLVQSAVELSCFGTGQSTLEEGRAAYQAWLKEHDRQIAEKAWEEGYIQAVKNMNPMPGEESPEYTPNCSACHWMRCCTSSPILKRPHPTRMISRPNSSNH